jgi:hypothetical protein
VAAGGTVASGAATVATIVGRSVSTVAVAAETSIGPVATVAGGVDTPVVGIGESAIGDGVGVAPGPPQLMSHIVIKRSA